MPCHTKRQCKDRSKKSNRQDNCEKKLIYGTLKKEIYLAVKIIFCNFAAEMVALPSKSGGVKEHQKGMRCDSSTVPAAVIPVL